MIVAIPTDNDRIDSPVCVSFGRSPYYLLHNTETGKDEFFPNPAADAPGGAGIQAAQFLVDRKADALITVRAGQNAGEVLLAAGVAVWKASGHTAAEELKALEAGNLSRLNSFHAGFHGRA